MSKTTEQKIARRLQSKTGAAYNKCLNNVRAARATVVDGPDFVERWESAALTSLNSSRSL